MNDKRRFNANKLIKGLAILLFWLTLWAVLAALIQKELYLPAPLSVGRRFLALAGSGDFWLSAVSSLARICAGFLLAMLTGMALAIAMRWSKIIYALLSPLIKAIRATPVASFIIIALVWFSSSRLPVFISFLMVLPIAWANTLAGIENTDARLLEMASLYKVRRGSVWLRIYWPSLRPYLITAATTGLGLAWKAGITAEVISGPKIAIGSELQNAKVSLETVDIFVWTLVVIALSILLERLMLFLLHRRKKKNQVGS